MLAAHRAPASYTGEDLIEISCHGGALVTAKVLEICLRAGARAARLANLPSALISMEKSILPRRSSHRFDSRDTDLALRSATEQLAGRLGDEFRNLRQRLIDIIAHVEASMDFPRKEFRRMMSLRFVTGSNH